MKQNAFRSFENVLGEVKAAWAVKSINRKLRNLAQRKKRKTTLQRHGKNKAVYLIQEADQGEAFISSLFKFPSNVSINIIALLPG